MRTNIRAILWIVMASILAGCKVGSGTEELSWIFATTEAPIQVAVALDADRTVEALIPVEGGTITATGADGTVYTLEIPSDALLNETTISMTPVSSIADMPFGGEQTYAVQLSPEGLLLQNYAILTITPAEEIPLAEQIFFGYKEEGEDLILAAPVVDSTEIKIYVLHFSGNGVTKGLLADIEPVRERLGGSAERRLDSALSWELARLRTEGGDAEAIAAAYEEAFRQYEEQVVKPRVEAAGESCAAGQLAIQTVLQLARWRALMGQSEGGDPFAKYPGLMDTAALVCVEEEYELCVEEHIIHRMLPVWLGFERQNALMPGTIGSDVLQHARDLTVQCLTFRLEFESTGSLDAGGGGFTSTVTSEITLRFNPDDFTITGEAPQVVEDYEFRLPGCNVSNYVTEGGTFKVFNLEILDERDETYGHVRDFILFYLPGITSASYDITCPPGGTIHQPPGGAAWYAAFNSTHIDELATGRSESDSGFVMVVWEIFGDEYFAKKEWIEEVPNIVEAGTFKLYHTPGG